MTMHKLLVYKRYCPYCDYDNKFHDREVIDGEINCVSCGDSFKVDIKRSEKEQKARNDNKAR